MTNGEMTAAVIALAALFFVILAILEQREDD